MEQLKPTLQTCVGMVMNGGAPASRAFPQIDYGTLEKLYNDELFESLSIFDDNSTRLVQNVWACRQKVDRHRLVQYIERDKRLDIEQCVALVISALPKDAVELAKTVPEMFKTCCMWCDKSAIPLSARHLAKEVREDKITYLLEIAGMQDGSILKLRAVRKHRPKLDNNQCLDIPSTVETIETSPDEIVIVSKNCFRKLQRHLNKLALKSDAKSVFVREVEAIRDDIRFPADRLACLKKSEDLYAVCYSFMAAQRNMQQKVVSDLGWTTFLAKGEGKFVLQNSPHILTTFEKVLVDKATDIQALTAIRIPPGKTNLHDDQQQIVRQITKVCRQMCKYVTVFGGGDMNKLCYDMSTSGGSGRGPVDTYNELVDLLKDLKARAVALGMAVDIKPCHKFLAKDIMHWNNGWKDDAFASGKIPGWVDWLETHDD